MPVGSYYPTLYFIRQYNKVKRNPQIIWQFRKKISVARRNCGYEQDKIKRRCQKKSIFLQMFFFLSCDILKLDSFTAFIFQNILKIFSANFT